MRKQWSNGYPLVHDRLGTYGIFEDVPLTTDVKIVLIPVAIEIALNETPEYFHCALFALAEVVPDDQILPRPSGFGEGLLKLRERVMELSFMPNIVGTWESLTTQARCLRPVEPDLSYECSLRELQVPSDSFLQYFPIPFPSLGDSAQAVCPVSMERITEEGNESCLASVTCDLEQSAIVRSSRWWIYRCKPNVPDHIWIGYVYVWQDENQQVEIGHWESHCEPMSEGDLHVALLQREFSPRIHKVKS
jgi:hypothetical protein